MMRMNGVPVVDEIFFLLWVLMMAGGIVGWILFLVAAWRLMRAQERNAEAARQQAGALEQLAERLSAGSGPAPPTA